MRNAKSGAILSVAACLWFVQAASGSSIAIIAGEAGAGATLLGGSGVVTTSSPNETTNPATNGNTLTLNESVTSVQSGPWYVELDIASAPGTTQYYVTKMITNNSSQTWNTFMVGFQNNIIDIDGDAYVPYPQPSPTLPSITNLGPGGSVTSPGTINAVNDSVTFSGLNVTPLDTIVLHFWVDVCDGCGGLALITEQGTASASPEPAAMSLAGAGLVILGVWRRRARRGVNGKAGG